MRHLRHHLGCMCLVSSLLLGSLVSPAHSQLAVIDAANLKSNTMTSLQTTITAIESVLQTGYMLMELEPWGSNPLDGSFGSDITELDKIITETQGILFDIRAIQQQTARIFALTSATDNTRFLRDRLLEIRLARAEAQRRARDIQTLPIRIRNVIGRIVGLWDRIMGVIGAKQTGQQVQAMLQQMTHVEAQSQVILAAYQQAVLTDMAERPVIEESLQKINEQLMADWPQ